MKKIISVLLTLVCALSLFGCSGGEAKVWDWAQSLTQEDVSAAEIWRAGDSNYVYEPLDDAQILELVTLLNKLTIKVTFISYIQHTC